MRGAGWWKVDARVPGTCGWAAGRKRWAWCVLENTTYCRDSQVVSRIVRIGIGKRDMLWRVLRKQGSQVSVIVLSKTREGYLYFWPHRLLEVRLDMMHSALRRQYHPQPWLVSIGVSYHQISAMIPPFNTKSPPSHPLSRSPGSLGLRLLLVKHGSHQMYRLGSMIGRWATLMHCSFAKSWHTNQ